MIRSDQQKGATQGDANSMVFLWRYCVLGLLVFGPLVVLMCLKPIHQSLEYHSFADTRSVLRIPNTSNVVSNLPFLLVGMAGLLFSYRRNLGPAKHAWIVFFAGIGWVSLGSAHYHWNPNNETLMWDRLPMTLGFMGLFVALFWEYTNSRLARHLLMPALLLGISTVLYWRWTDDLRPYAWIQVMPLLTVDGSGDDDPVSITLLTAVAPGRRTLRLFGGQMR